MSRKPVRVAAASEVPPGERKIVDVDGKSVGLFNVGGRYVAVRNLCPHELAPVCRGRVSGTTVASEPGQFRWGREGEILSCPWHGWEFDLLTGEALCGDRRGLTRYEVTVDGDDLVITI